MELTAQELTNLLFKILVIGVPAFFLSRWINLWYWKVNEFKKGQEEQIRLLKKIAGEKESEKEEITQE